eukprot:39633-Chlamydomonas_euryale.AAC.2
MKGSSPTPTMNKAPQKQPAEPKALHSQTVQSHWRMGQRTRASACLVIKQTKRKCEKGTYPGQYGRWPARPIRPREPPNQLASQLSKQPTNAVTHAVLRRSRTPELHAPDLNSMRQT